jgi:hypothetical protein
MHNIYIGISPTTGALVGNEDCVRKARAQGSLELVAMGVNETGHNHLTRRIDRCGVASIYTCGDLNDSGPFDQNIAFREVSDVGVH